MNYLLRGFQLVQILTDHRSLLYVSAPLMLGTYAENYILAKVHQWTIHLLGSIYSVRRVNAPKNEFADMLTAWTKECRRKRAKRKLLHYMQILYQAQLKCKRWGGSRYYTHRANSVVHKRRRSTMSALQDRTRGRRFEIRPSNWIWRYLYPPL